MNTGRNLRGSMGGKDIVPKGYEISQLSNFDPKQTNLYNRSYDNLSPDSFLSKIAGGDQSAFDEMEAPAYRQFNELTGGLASKFSSGSGGQSLGLGGSSGFKNANTAAASNFAQDLQSKRYDLRRQAINDLFGMSESLLNQRPYDRQLVQKPQRQNGFGWGDVLAPLATAAGTAFGGPLGGAAAGGITNYFTKKPVENTN